MSTAAFHRVISGDWRSPGGVARSKFYYTTSTVRRLQIIVIALSFTNEHAVLILDILGVLVAQRFGRRTLDRGGRGLDSRPVKIKAPRSTQPSIPPGYVNRVPCSLHWLGLRRAVLAYVGNSGCK